MTEPLKQCPFCLAGDAGLVELWEAFDAGHIAHIHCERCGASGPGAYSEADHTAAITLARACWNARAEHFGGGET